MTFSHNLYDSCTAAMHGCVPKCVGEVAYNFYAPRRLKIYDPVLGLLEKVLQILVIIYAAITMFSARTYLYTEAPDGSPILFFERLDFNTERNEDWNAPNSNLTYCAQPDGYAYLVPKKDSNGNTVSPVLNETTGKFEIGTDSSGNPLVNYWNDDKPACKQLNFAEIVKKTEHTAYITTWQKETLSTVRQCFDVDGTNANGQTCESAAIREASDFESTVLKKSDGKPFFRTKERQTAFSNEYSCTCLELRNYMPVAPEHVGIRFYHTYTTSEEVGGITGSTTMAGGLNPTTVIRRKPSGAASGSTLNGATSAEKVIAPGEPIVMSVQELLDLAGVPDGLDGPIERRFADLVPGQPAPTRRTKGVTINMDMLYDVDADAGTAVCNLEVSYTDGEVSWSPDVQMHERQVLDAFTDSNLAANQVVRQYSELYNRGVKVHFSAKGKVAKFEFVYFMGALIQLFVLLPLTTTVVCFLATMVMPRKDLYNPAISETLSYDRELSKFAANSALAAAQFQVWSQLIKANKESGDLAKICGAPLTQEDCQLTPQDLANLLQPVLSDEQATLLAGQIFSHGDEDGDGMVSVQELIDIVSTDIVDFEKLQAHMKRKDTLMKHASEKVLAGTAKPQPKFALGEIDIEAGDVAHVQNPVSP